MFIISLTYIVSLDKVNENPEAHVEYLKEQYSLGHFLASGRKNPRTGGIILSNVEKLSDLENIIDKDPFKQNKIADYEIIEFEPSMADEKLNFLLKI